MTPHGRFFQAVALSGIAAAVAFGITGASARSGNQQISSGDPYAKCTVPDTTGFLNPSTEIEPNVAVGGEDNQNVIAVWQQDRWSTGGARGLVAGVSKDGGRHFDQVTLPFDRCAKGGLPYQRASDPWVSIGPDGTAYAVSISFNKAADGSTPGSTVGAATSHDGGKTWVDTKALINDTDPTVLDDKESVTADPVHPGVAYVVWDRATATNQPGLISKTTDGGRTWSTPTFTTSPTDSVIGDIVVVDPRTDKLYDFFDRFINNFTAAQESFITSVDGGTTWTPPQPITSDMSVQPIDPHTGSLLRTSFGLPEPAIDAKTGQLYMVWEDARFSGGAFNDIAYTTSKDGGVTWSTPVAINTPNTAGTSATNPQIAVTPKGVVGVMYTDTRNAVGDFDPATFPTNYWFETAPPGGAAFGNEQAIVRTPFDQLTAPVSDFRGYFLGDYQGLAASSEGFDAVFIKSNDAGDTQNRTDAFFSSIQAETGSEHAARAAAPARSAPANGAAVKAKARHY